MQINCLYVSIITLVPFVIMNNAFKKSKQSAIHSHSADTGHIIDFENPEILSTDKIKYRLQIKETLLIHDYSASDSLNINVKSFECKLW